jgi:electron transport complex protein RnfG
MSDAGNGSGRDRRLPQAQGAPEPPEVSTGKLLATLGSAGAVAGLLIVLVYQVTQPAIQAHKAQVLREAVQEVLGGPQRYDTLYVWEGALTPSPPQAADPTKLQQIFVGYDQSGERIGVAVAGAQPGFQDVVELIFGYEPRTRTVLGMKVLASRETPGLGDKIDKDQAFISEFEGAEAPLVGVKSGRATGAANEVDMITGATISSRTVISIINGEIERLQPMLETYLAGAH